jgi:site-specific DNA-methyltransferase (adenine-specific)
MIEFIHGNCLDILPELDVDWNKVILVSDPPFNIGFSYNLYGDKMPAEEYYEMLAKIFRKFPHVLIHYPEPIIEYCITTKNIPTKIVQWIYNTNQKRQHRSIAYFNIKPDFTGKGEYKNPNDKRIKERMERGLKPPLYDWWYVDIVKNVTKKKNNWDHPCVMPVEVFKNIISTLPKDYTIIDPFLGSGTCGVAAKELDRNFIGIELDEKYINICKNRLI